MTRPIQISTLRHLFERAVTNIISNEGEPAELGKSDAGPVFYDDGTTVHRNHIWARKGANSEVLIRVRADGFNLPDTPGIPIRVAERNGIFWLVSWQQEDYAPAAGGGGGSVGIHRFSPEEIQIVSGATREDVTSFTPYIEMPDSVLSHVLVSFIAELESTALTINIYSEATVSGDVVLDADAYGGKTDGTGTPTDINGFVSSQAFAEDGFIQKHSLTLSFTGQDPLGVGDYCSVILQRLGSSSSPADTLAGDLRVLMIEILEEGATAGSGGGGGTFTWPFVAKGDLITTANGSDPSILSVGVDGQILTADAAQALGIKWADAPDPDVDSLTLVPRTAPATPSSGHILYVDSTDNILKSKGSSGTVTQLANP